jgi:YidC/Oxa1 family membrane protein insertase
MIPSRGALRALPQQNAARRLPAQSTSRLACQLDSIASRRHISTRPSSSTLLSSSSSSASLRLRSPTLAISTTTTTTTTTARSLSLWPFRSSKPSTPEPTTTTPLEPTPEAATPLEPIPEPTAFTSTTTTPPPPSSSSVDADPELAAILSETIGQTPTTTTFADGLIPDPTTLSILDMPEQIGYLSALGIDFGWGPSSIMSWLLEHVHVYSGLPWWGSIVATAFVVRMLVAPLAVRQSEAMRRMTVLNTDPQYRALTEQMMAMMREKTAMTQQAEFQTIRKMLGERKKEAGVRWRDMWIPMAAQIPIGFAMWRLLRTMADIPVPGLETGGLLWFQDLALADPFYILPMVNPALVFMMNKANSAFQTEVQAKQTKRMFYVMGPVSFFFTLWMPAGLQLYFITTFSLTALQTFALRNTTVRNILGLPPWTPPKPPAPTTLDTSAVVYQAPRDSSASATAVAAAAAGEAAPDGGSDKPARMGDRIAKAAAEAVPWAPTPEQKKKDEKEKKLREADEAEKRLEELQRERRRREFENRFS